CYRDWSSDVCSSDLALSWVRSRVLQLIDRYRPSAVAVRYPETFGPGGKSDAAHQRCRVEGVVLEAADSRGLPACTGALVTISAKIGRASCRERTQRS